MYKIWPRILGDPHLLPNVFQDLGSAFLSNFTFSNPKISAFANPVWQRARGSKTRPDYTPLYPVLPFLVFLVNSLFFFFCPCEEFLVFSSVFPFFSRDFWGLVGIKNPCFLGGFPCLLPQKRQGKEGQGRALRDRLMSRGKNCLPTVSRQFLTRNYPRPNCLLKCLPNCLSPTREGLFFPLQN